MEIFVTVMVTALYLLSGFGLYGISKRDPARTATRAIIFIWPVVLVLEAFVGE